MAKQKRTEFKEYISKRLEEEIEYNEVCDMLGLAPEDDFSRHIALARIFSVCGALESGYVNDVKKNLFLDYLAKRDYPNTYRVVKDVFFHYFLSFTVSLRELPKALTRHILLPIRSSLGDVIYAVLAAFRCEGYHLTELMSSDFRFAPSHTRDEDSDCADEYPSFILHELKNPQVVYDFGENYTFNIRMRKGVFVSDEDAWASCLCKDGAGYGIIEDDKFALLSYLETGGFPEDIDPDMLESPDIDYRSFDLEELDEEFEVNFLTLRDRYVFGATYMHESVENEE